MDAESSEHEDRDTPGPRPTPPWLKVIDRILWGVNAPTSGADRSRRYKGMGKDILGAAKWVGNRFFS